MTTKQITREQWLQHAVTVLRSEMKPRGVVIPEVKVSCSWPGGGSARKRIGECWATGASKARINEIFISPKIESSSKAVSILLHELAHAVDDCKNAHRAPFTAIGKLMGMTGKPTQMQPAEADADAWAQRVINKHGVYPHQTLDKSMSPTKKQTARMIRCECTECSAVWRMSGKVIAAAIGELSCPVCHTQEEGAISINT
jgi:hypothetical protein